MRKIQNLYLTELLMQLRYTPLDKRKKQLEAAEKLLFSLKPGTNYPAEFVCYKITGYRLESLADQEPANESSLSEDLRIFIAKLSALTAPLVSDMSEKVYTIEDLAKTISVSIKTINRWRKNDLIARKYIFGDGKKRFGFSQTVVDKFLKKNPGLTDNAKNFTQLTNKEKQQIVNYARKLGVKTTLSRYQIIEKIAKKNLRAHETIRYLLENYEKKYPDKPIFDKFSARITIRQTMEIYELFENGETVAELTKKFERSKSAIYRIINRRRAKTLPIDKIEFISSNEFEKDDAFEKILGGQKFSELVQNGENLKPSDSSLPQYLRTLKQAPLLKREREIELFCRYNFLKFLAHRLCSQLNINNPSGTELSKIEKYLAWAEQIRKTIIEANIWLVVSIASKHNKGDTGLLDWVSEGNFSLMRAVEKFNYTRNVRFSTYVSLAIAKDFAHKISAEVRRPDKQGTTLSMANIDRDLRISKSADFSAIDRARKSLIQVIKNNLDDREQYIIIYHFGLTGTLIRKDKKTLKEIGEHLGLTKERIRQLELIALQKLKRSLSIEQFELLTS